MTTHIDEKKYQIQAGQDLTADSVMHHAISIVAGTITAVPRAAGGVLKTKVNSGNNAAIVYDGITKVAVGAAVSTAGWPLTITTSGWFTVSASGDFVVGRSLGTAASGSLLEAFVNFQNLSAMPS